MSTTARARSVVEALVNSGATHFFIAPGARSTPLVAALHRAQAKMHLVLDERSAAFAALGVSRMQGLGVVVTTSGTAVANLLPACVEAFHDEVPMVLLSADRPRHLVGSGANQTVNQVDFLRSSSVAMVDVSDAPMTLATQAEVAAALAQLRSSSPGPVHINMRFSKPLEPNAQSEHQSIPLSVQGRTVSDEQTAIWDTILTRMGYAKKGVVVVGSLPISQRDGVARIVESLEWLTFADALSQMPRDAAKGILTPRPLNSATFRDALQSDLVLWLGGRCVSPQIAQWAKSQEVDVVQIKPFHRTRDPDRLMVESLTLPLEHFAESVERAALSSGFATQEGHPHQQALAAYQTLSTPDATELSEPVVASLIAESSNHYDAVYLGNSMPVRDVDVFGHALDAKVLANRGASGIDGNLSTVLGAALCERGPILALLGDLTTLHDISALREWAKSEVPVRLVVVNNSGGGIFHFLPVASHEAFFEPFFGTPHDTSLAALAKAFGVESSVVSTYAELKNRLEAPCDKAELIEVRTRRDENLALHRRMSEADEKAMATFLVQQEKQRGAHDLGVFAWGLRQRGGLG